MTDILSAFPDTKEFLTPSEMNTVKNFESKGGYAIDTDCGFTPSVLSLLNKGYLYLFEKFPHIYICLTSSVSARPVTSYFYAYKIKVGVNKDGVPKILTPEEQNNLFLMRKFVAEWIFHKETIPDKKYRDFLRFFSVSIPYVISVPKFLVGQMEKDLENTGIEAFLLTPEFNLIR